MGYKNTNRASPDAIQVLLNGIEPITIVARWGSLGKEIAG
jgi:hypothetical protein